jgi:hypothetical protein
MGLTVYLPKSATSTVDVGGISDWTTIKTYTTTVLVPGPFVVAIDARDYGVIGGIAAVVLVDGRRLVSRTLCSS